jgi:chitin-binding protein
VSGSPDPDRPATTVPGTPAAATTSRSDSGPSLPLLAGGAAAVAVLAGGTALVVRRRRG